MRGCTVLSQIKTLTGHFVFGKRLRIDWGKAMESNLDSMFKTNKTLEKEGVDFVIREENKEEKIGEISFRVRRFNASNPRVKAAMAAYYKPYARMIELGTLPQDKTDEINIKLFVDVCLVSWAGVEDKNGAPIEFSKDNAIKLLKGLPDMFDTLWKYANDFANYKEELGNS